MKCKTLRDDEQINSYNSFHFQLSALLSRNASRWSVSAVPGQLRT